MMLAALLTQFEKGFYVDVGAYHPVKYSNTYHFYKKGWTGINIDAAPGSMTEFRKIRPRDTNIEVAISETPGMLTYYYQGAGSSMNTFSTEYLEQYKVAGLVAKELKIEAKRLENILEQYAGNNYIHFMSVDVEGLEISVLKSNNWKKFRPYVIVLESYEHMNDENNYDLEIRDFMSDKGYRLMTKTMTSIFFIRDDLRFNQFNHITFN